MNQALFWEELYSNSMHVINTHTHKVYGLKYITKMFNQK
jgi:hypothetical protein